MSELSDADLLRRSRSDPDAICVLYDRHCESLLAALLRRGNDRELAFDVMQETFVRVLQTQTCPSRRRRVGVAVALDGGPQPVDRRGTARPRRPEGGQRLRYSTVTYDSDALDPLFERLAAEELAGQLEHALGELPAAQRDA